MAGVLMLLNVGHLLRSAGVSMFADGLSGLLYAAALVVFAWLQCLIALILAAFNRRALRYWTALLILLTLGAAYYSFMMRLPIGSGVIRDVLVADQTEFRETIDIRLLAVLALIGLPLAWLVIRAEIGPGFALRWPVSGKAAAPILVAVAVVSAMGFTHFVQRGRKAGDAYNEARRFVAPFNVVLSSGELAAKTLRSRRVKVRDITAQFAAVEQSANRSDPEIIIVVLGESARSANFQIAGYARPTNPRLKREANLVVIGSARACGTRTIDAIPCLLSRLGNAEFSLPRRETSLVGIVRSLGYKTLWLSTQNTIRNRPIMRLCREAHVCKVGLTAAKERNFDGLLLDHVRAVIAAKTGPAGDPDNRADKTEGKTFIILHTRGSHFVYQKRYPSEFAKFKPECKGPSYGCNRDEVINSYDNSILYTDHVLAELIALLRNHRAALFYTSDHGESLGEYLFYGHGTPIRIAPVEQTQVPVLAWLSDRFIRARNLDPGAIRSKLAASGLATHDQVFHSVLGCLGARSALIDAALNVCDGAKEGPARVARP